MPSIATYLAIPASLATLALAKTDISGCTTTDMSSPAGASVAWYVPETGELCEILDCGGGRAPPKYDVPGCAAYTGSASYTPSYLDGYTPGAQASQTHAPTTAAETKETKAPAPTAYPHESSSVEIIVDPIHSSSAEVIVDPIRSSTVAVSSPAVYTSMTLEEPHTMATSVRYPIGNGTVPAGPTGGANTTSSGGAPSQTENAAEMTKAYVGGAGLVAGIMAVVFAL